ncbi:malonic semialdehyde reductase [Sphingomonas sp. RB3P16]|uniref:malonic semialdehyde reductase n=1 Tax=Parasphingomonas frigoris TaxID=3096163 RepID=UPI002FC9996B
MTAIPDQALDQIFRTARSFNGYTDAPVSESDLHAIWDLMKWGPTSANQLPARMVWVTSEAAKAKLAAACSAQNAPKVLNAPVTVIIGMDGNFHDHLPELFPHVDARPWFANDTARAESAFRNSTLQGAYFIIAARALGFDTGPMSGFDAKAVNAAFFADTPAVTTNFISTLGHGDPATVFGRLPRPAFEKFNALA